MAATNDQESDQSNWTTLEDAFNQIGRVHFGLHWNDDTILLSQGRFREEMDKRDIPQRVSWPIPDPMRPFLERIERQAISDLIPYPAHHDMISNFEFVERQILKALGDKSLKGEFEQRGSLWLPFEPSELQNQADCKEVSYKDSEVQSKEDEGCIWRKVRVDTACLNNLIADTEKELAARSEGEADRKASFPTIHREQTAESSQLSEASDQQNSDELEGLRTEISEIKTTLEDLKEIKASNGADDSKDVDSLIEGNSKRFVGDHRRNPGRPSIDIGWMIERLLKLEDEEELPPLDGPWKSMLADLLLNEYMNDYDGIKLSPPPQMASIRDRLKSEFDALKARNDERYGTR